jgi:hypothetical protein
MAAVSLLYSKSHTNFSYKMQNHKGKVILEK